jgi:hypothetical protein
MYDAFRLARLLVHAERETTRSMLLAELSIATSRHLLDRLDDLKPSFFGTMPAGAGGGSSSGKQADVGVRSLVRPPCRAFGSATE